MFDDLVNGRTKFHNVFHYPAETWGDVAVHRVADRRRRAGDPEGAARFVLPAVRARDAPHLRRGVAAPAPRRGPGARAGVAGPPAQRALFQDAVNRWWRADHALLRPAVEASKDVLLDWGIKTRSNESLRQEFFSTYVPKLWDVGISVPDPELRLERGRAASGTGPSRTGTSSGRWWGATGPMTVRLARRKTVWDTHAWIREAFAGIPRAPEGRAR